MADLLKAEQRGVNVKPFGQELVCQAGGDVVGIRVAGQDPAGLRAALPAQHLAQLCRLLAGRSRLLCEKKRILLPSNVAQRPKVPKHQTTSQTPWFAYPGVLPRLQST